jgi:hypothetical protein
MSRYVGLRATATGQVPKHMRPGRPGFVIGALNGSVEAAREYNRKLHEGAWRDLHEYGIFKLMVDGENYGYPWYMRRNAHQEDGGGRAERDVDGAGRAGGEGSEARKRELLSVSNESRSVEGSKGEGSRVRGGGEGWG